MDTPLDEQYLTWLYARIGPVTERDKSKTYWMLLKHLYKKEFVWLVPNDDNRVEDGRDLRLEFLDEMGLSRRVDQDWMGMGCSVLELLMGLAKILSFEADRTPLHWFWVLLNNLGLNSYSDAVYTTKSIEETIDDKLDNFIWRTYDGDGRGGAFPLNNPQRDQRDVELWYQLCAYILDRF